MYCYRISRCLGLASFLFAVTALLSCESEKQPAAFYPVDSLISDQINYLTSIRAGLFKEALLSGKVDTITITPADTTAWQKELEIFRKLDEINRPVNKEYYEVTHGQIDPRSNLRVQEVQPRKELPVKVREQLQVVYLKIYYQGNIAKPRKIEAQYDEGNQLFESARFLAMHFQQIENRTVLTSYSVRGGQKMVFGDSVAFYIGGKVLVD